MHAALREVLGPTALQSGSYNRPGYLRLDFGWTSALSPEQVRDIELVSQQALRADLPVAWDYMTLEQAKEWGAIALFGETYDNTKVRVVEIGGPWSRELCGGTHVAHSSQIGTVVVTGETSVGSGNRRIEALTGVEGFGYLARERDVVAQLTGLLKTQPDDLVGRVQAPHRATAGPPRRSWRRRGVAQLLGASAELAAGATARRTGQASSPTGPTASAAATYAHLALDVRGRLPQGEPGVVVVIGISPTDRQGVRGRRHQRRGPRPRAVGRTSWSAPSARCSAARVAARTTSPRAAAPTPRASTRRWRWWPREVAAQAGQG